MTNGLLDSSAFSSIRNDGVTPLSYFLPAPLQKGDVPASAQPKACSQEASTLSQADKRGGDGCNGTVVIEQSHLQHYREPGSFITANANKQSSSKEPEESQELHEFTALSLNSLAEPIHPKYSHKNNVGKRNNNKKERSRITRGSLQSCWISSAFIN
ncbi:hypothetical protein EYF80_010404 [Liparis tanakae]|uniref:Uncharacterized protein n=1 Tax=Liparis tanakae TaxID=230148 RepID=A0A4Z2IMW0_9TELE|nr:hypothetical protein EYF80_010404 [Liparis tanakae]